ncbi:hypothetical protein BH10PAT3_BH10PAT3_4020 [soil metagenome]
MPGRKKVGYTVVMPSKKTMIKKSFGEKLALFLRLSWVHLCLVLLCFTSLLFVRLYVNNPITGDEPHYMLMARSLVKDHDLNLKNNYQNNDSADFYPGLSPKFQVGYGQGENDTSRWYSIHGIGLPLLIAPGLWLFGVKGVEVTMVLLATITVILSWIWVETTTKSKKYAYSAAVALLMCYSYNGLSGYVYPDIVIAGLSLAALIIIQRYYMYKIARFGFGFIIGFMPLLHFKSLAVCLPLLIVMLYKVWTNKKKIPWEAGALFIPMFLYLFLSIHGWFGVWNPTHIYKGLGLIHVSPIAVISGVLFDSMRGLLVYNPVILLIFAGILIWYKLRKESFLLTIFVALPSLFILATFGAWQGGDSQLGRYSMDFLPLFLPSIAFVFVVVVRNWQKLLIWLLFAATLGITVQSIALKRMYIRSETRSPNFAQIERGTGLPIDRLLPTFDERTKSVYPHGKERVLVGYAVLVLFFVGDYRLSKGYKLPKKRSKRSLTN